MFRILRSLQLQYESLKERFFHLPRYKRWLLLVPLLLAAGGYWGVPLYEYKKEYSIVYEEYFAHFYKSYRKTLPANQAEFYADFYAAFYADYYASEEYRESLAYALPAATKESLRYPPNSPVAGHYTNTNGLALIKEFEGLRFEPYVDPAGKLTVGYGHLIRRGEYHSRMSESAAEALLRQDILVAEAIVKRNVKVPLSSNQFSALVSLVYNIGSGHFEDSRMLNYINDRKFEKAAKEFLRWRYVGSRKLEGLARRREAERDLFMS